MKIVLYGINFYPELTGIGKYTGELAAWLVARGHEVRVVAAPPYYPHWRVGQAYSAFVYKKEKLRLPSGDSQTFHGDTVLTVVRCPLWVPSRLTGGRRLLHLLSFALSSMPVMLRQSFWRPDVILVVEPPLFCAPTAWFAAKLCGAKAWLHVQDFEVDAAFELGMLKGQWKRRLVMAVERWLLRRFDQVSTISNRMLQRLREKGLSSERCEIFQNWVDTQNIYPMEEGTTSVQRGDVRFEGIQSGVAESSSRGNDELSFRRELGLKDSEVVALYSGNMGQKQGLEIIIAAAKILESVDDIKFVLCGQGAAFQRLRAMASDANNIMWLPLQPLERLNELLNLADIHLLPQRADAADLVMPSKLTGMLASGRPVVATAAQGTEIWSVVEGRGINTNPGDAQSFAAAIKELAGDPVKRSVLGRAARIYAEANLGMEAVLRKFEDDLVRVVSEQKA